MLGNLIARGGQYTADKSDSWKNSALIDSGLAPLPINWRGGRQSATKAECPIGELPPRQAIGSRQHCRRSRSPRPALAALR